MSAPPLTLDPKIHARVTAAIEAIRQGQMVIVIDDEDRENEGDLTMAAQHVTPEAVNFMAKYGRGLICLTLTEEQIDRLQLPLMELHGRSAPPLGTAFTVSIEARHGVSTGISAQDRAHTMRVAADPRSGPDDLVIPGHVFPLRARNGGVLVRTGQTEGSVDLARLAGLTPAGIICEVMNDDGSMARLPDLQAFCKEHNLRLVTIADLVQYRLHTEPMVTRVREHDLVLDHTSSVWRAVHYRSNAGGDELLALVRTSAPQSAENTRFFDGQAPVLCRVHRGHFLRDLFASGGLETGGSVLRAALSRIEAEGSGVVVYLPPQGSIESELAELDSEASPGPQRKQDAVLREFGLGAQVLADLGVGKIRLLSGRSRKVPGLAGFGLEIVERVSLFADSSSADVGEGK